MAFLPLPWQLAVSDNGLYLDSNTSRKSVSQEQSVEVIHLDLLRTFPTLGFFQEVSEVYLAVVLD